MCVLLITRLLQGVGRWARKPVNHTSWVAVVTPTDRPNSVLNRCLIGLLCGVVCVVTLPFGHFCWYRGFCHRTKLDLLLFVLSSNIPSSPAHGGFICQLIRYARACSSYECFILRVMRLSSKLLKKEYLVKFLKSSYRKFYGQYGDLIQQYEVSFSRMLKDILSLDQLQRDSFPEPAVSFLDFSLWISLGTFSILFADKLLLQTCILKVWYFQNVYVYSVYGISKRQVSKFAF